MSFAQVCGVVTCAVVAIMGCGDDRDHDARGTAASQPSSGRPVARAGKLTTSAGSAATIELVGDGLDGAPVVTGFTQGVHGSVSLAGKIATYQPAPGYVGDDRFTFTISDADGEASSASVDVAMLAALSSCTLTISGPTSAVIGPPIHLQATATCITGTPEVQWRHRVGTNPFSVFRNYSTSLTADFVTTNGPVGTHQFVARVRAQGTTQTFTSNTLTVALGNPVAPKAVDDTLVLDEDTTGSVNVLANDLDPNGDPLSAAITVAPVAGTATLVAGILSYAPAPNYHGDDAITYTIDDGHGHTAAAVVHITVNPVNDAPSANHDFLTVAEDGAGAVDVVANDSDIDGDALTVTAITAPDHGTATLSGTVVSYTPAPDYHGPDQLEYTVSDGQGGTSTASLFVTVTSVNDPPTAVDDALTLAEDTTAGVYVLGNDVDPDGEIPTVVAFDQPAHGTVSIVAGFASYHPDHDYNGLDAFSYTVADAAGAQSTATVHITVLAVNDPPVATDDSATVDEDTSATIDVVANDHDVDGDPLVIASVTQPPHGTVVIASGHEITYTPVPDYNGPDAFTYSVRDPSGARATGRVTLVVANVNDPPVAAADRADLDEDTGATIDVVANDTDVDGDPLVITGVTQPAHGSAAIVDATHIAYTPEANYHGPDAFTYTIEDGNGGVATGEVTLAVASVNDAPVAAEDAATTAEDTPATIDVVANDGDLDGDALAITGVTQPAHGIAEIADAHHVIYTPAADYNGGDAFSYTIGDGNGGTATAGVTIAVTPVNDAPVANADAASLLEDGSAVIDVVANDADADGDALAIASVTQPAHGAATISDAHHVVYTPAPNFHGADGFSYTIADPSGAPATAAVVIDVISVNDAPIANADAASLDEDTAVTVDVVANDFDVDGDALAIAILTQPAHGLATLVDGHRVLYVPAPDYHGPDALSYTIDDGHGGQATAELALDVASVNDAPVAAADAASLDEDTAATIDVIANDSDVDGDALAIASITQPAHGAAAIADARRVQYTPAANYHGPDSFAYTVDDGHGGQATATVALDVISVNDAPVAADDAASLDEDTVATVDVAANDSDVDGDALTIASITQPAHGAAAIADAHHVQYTPAANYHGPDALQYTIGDGNGGQATATLALSVASVNDAPVAAGVVASTFDDTSVVVALSASDADGDPLVLAIAAGPAHGTLGPIAGNHVTYTPAPGFAGADGFSYTASDGQVSSAAATVAITVVRSVCGNGVREGVHEECDDGNTTPGDGCEAGCKLTCGSGTGADRATVDSVSGHCFVAYDGLSHSYQEAAALCAGFGGHLPTIASATEDEVAFAAVRAGDSPWLGGDDIAVEGAFHWTTGEPFGGYTNFLAGKPDNAGNADCLVYAAGGTWSDASCAATTGTLCELEVATPTPAFATGGTGTRGVAVADINGDGYLDVVATNPTSNTVGVLLGNGAGGFVLQATYPTGTGPAAVAAGDFDGDGHPDLAIVNATANTVSILRGGAGGVFTAGTSFAIAAGATSIAVADFNQDGALDLAIAASATVQVFRGNGAAGFTALTSVAITGVPASIAVGDFDRDGRPDLVVTTPVAVLVVRSTGAGTFGLPVSLAVSVTNRSVIAADLDGDGNLDLAVANGAASVSVWFGSATGVFGLPTTLTVAGTPLVVAAGDFDGDGGRDLVALTSGHATLFHGAARTFTQTGAPVAIGGLGASVAVVGNVNGDAAQDLVVANATTSTVGLLLGGTGGFAGARALASGTGATSTVAADFNGDGVADLAVVDPATSKVNVFLQTAGGLVQSSTITLASGAGSSYAVAADFDGDGRLDLAIVNVTFSSVSVVLGAGNGTFATPINVGVSSSPRRPAVGDFNGDGRPDLAVPTAVGNTVTILNNLGSGRFGRAGDLPAGIAPAAAVVGDFNGDGKKDIAVATTGEATVKVMLGHGDNTFAAATTFPVASAGQALAMADLDGDGKLDLIATTTTAGGVSILHGTGTGAFTAAVNVATGSQPSCVVAADLDGDTRLDLVVGNAGTNDVTVLHSDGAGGFAPYRANVGAPPTWLTVTDLDRDGHLDLAVSSANAFVTLMFSAR
jgi:cysteine-rich repeat protein